MAMSTQETLLAFSEWLDSQGLVVPPDDGAADRGRVNGDNRSHDELAREFIQQWEARSGTATLAGRAHVRPHSRACGVAAHDHGTECSSNCPTCGGK